MVPQPLKTYREQICSSTSQRLASIFEGSTAAPLEVPACSPPVFKSIVTQRENCQANSKGVTCSVSRTTHMPILQKHPDSFWRDVRSLPQLQFVSDPPQQVQSCVPVLPVLQLNAMVFSRHSDTGEPGEDTKKLSSTNKAEETTLIHSRVHPQLGFPPPSSHLLFNSSSLSAGTIMFP